jgi:hypothetical protein
MFPVAVLPIPIKLRPNGMGTIRSQSRNIGTNRSKRAYWSPLALLRARILLTKYQPKTPAWLNVITFSTISPAASIFARSSATS